MQYFFSLYSISPQSHSILYKHLYCRYFITGITARLVDGGNSREGRVEVSVNGGAWGTVCDDSFGMTDANVVCRSLGYPSAENFYSSAHFGAGSGDILLDDVECLGNETSLSYCTHRTIGEHNCGHVEDVSVVCARKY